MDIILSHRHYAAIHKKNLERSGLYVTSMAYPNSKGRTDKPSDRKCFSHADREYEFIQCKDENEARHTVQLEVLVRSSNSHADCAYQIACYESELQLAKLLEDQVMTDHYQEALKEQYQKWEMIKSIRRTTVRELREVDIRPIKSEAA